MKRYLVYIGICTVLILMWTCGGTEQNSVSTDESPVHPITENVSYASLNAEQRQSKLQECASCHADVHREESVGAHSQSYSRLLEHKAMADTSRFFPKGYNKYVDDNFKNLCVPCHTGENLFETNYLGLDTISDMRLVTKQRFPTAWNMPVTREDSSSWITGVDCLTCHQKGNQVITREGFKRNLNVKAPCNPVASKFFSSNENCVSCHMVIYEGMVGNVNDNGITKDMSCNSCHMEKDADGQSTHYYYWRHDAEGKEKYKLVKGAFEGITIRKTERATYAVTWNNQCSPHRYSECAEIIGEFTFLSKDGTVCGKFTKRLNNKQIHDPFIESYFVDDSWWGEQGCPFSPMENNYEEYVKISCDEAFKVKIEGYSKPQYWISDQLAEKVYEGVIRIDG